MISIDISIVVPTHNRAKLFTKAIDSLIAQTNPYWEAIVVDDNSSPTEKEKIKDYCAKDSRIRFIENKWRKGASAARNLGLQETKSDCVLFLDSDDILAPHCIENRSNIIKSHPNYDFWVFDGVRVFHQQPGDSELLWNVFTEENDLHRFLKVDPPWHTSSPVWNKKALLSIGGFNESALVWNDWDLHIRAIANGLSYKKITAPTDAYYRKHEQEAISKSDKTHENTLNRYQTLKQLILLLKEKKLLDKKAENLISQQLFFMQLEQFKVIMERHNLFQLVKTERLLPKFQYTFWKKYLSLYPFTKTRPTKKLMDKFAYTILNYHFLEIESQFLKTSSRNNA